MKKIVIALLLVASLFGVKAQGKVDSSLVVYISRMADAVAEFDTLAYRPIVIADSTLNYYATVNEYAILFDKAMILFWNSKGERVRLWLRKGEYPELMIEGEPVRQLLPINVEK